MQAKGHKPNWISHVLPLSNAMDWDAPDSCPMRESIHESALSAVLVCASASGEVLGLSVASGEVALTAGWVWKCVGYRECFAILPSLGLALDWFP